MKCNCRMVFIISRKKRDCQKTGQSKKRLYKLWASVKSRCDKRTVRGSNKTYRQIKISYDWASSFNNFERDMGERPTKKHSIDRKDNSKGYCKHNCRWATAYEQVSNRVTIDLSVQKHIIKTRSGKYSVRVHIPKQDRQLATVDSLKEARSVLINFNKHMNKIADTDYL